MQHISDAMPAVGYAYASVWLRENEKLEEAACAVLKHLGEIKRPYLNTFEEELLTFIEEKCLLSSQAVGNTTGC